MKRSAWRYLWKSEDIRKKLLYTLILLVIYRLAANIPVPGIDRSVLEQLTKVGGASGTLFNLLDMLSGGTMSRFSILAMGVYPYITAQIILTLLVPIIPALDRKLKENPREGQKWMERWTVILTIPMALLSAVGQINIFNSFFAAANTFIILRHSSHAPLYYRLRLMSLVGVFASGVNLQSLDDRSAHFIMRQHAPNSPANDPVWIGNHHIFQACLSQTAGVARMAVIHFIHQAFLAKM